MGKSGQPKKATAGTLLAALGLHEKPVPGQSVGKHPKEIGAVNA